MVTSSLVRQCNASAKLLLFGFSTVFIIFLATFSTYSSEGSRESLLPVDTYSNTEETVERIERIAKYSGVSETAGRIFSVDRHFVRRRSRRDVRSLRRTRGLRGISRECGHSCTLRLRSGDTAYLVHLHVWRQLPLPHNKSLHDLENGDVIPLVQYISSNEQIEARMGRTNPDCFYRARVHKTEETSIVNLCEEEGGLVGLLALPDGVYSVEPFNNSTAGHRHKEHIVHRFKSHNFNQYDSDPVENNEKNEEVGRGFNYTYEGKQWEDMNMRHTRSRRSANSWDHYVEVFVVADTKMYEYHGRNIESYILTLFSTVASIYRHQSLRAAINIVVVKIQILKSEYAGPEISANAQQSLQQFCRWQQLYNNDNDDSPIHHDVAILLTRKDICRAHGKCDTLGLAELGTMCDKQKSCAIIEDNGLSAAFTIAHELGHIFNIPHDDERKCGEFMQLSKHNYHIMAPTLEYNTHPWSWSACSSAMLEAFLERRSQLECLTDQPIERKYYDEMFEYDSPGRKYDVNQQCKFVFGEHAELCPYMPSCRRLWCSIQYGGSMGCRTQHMPWADGTPCDKNGHMYCHRGECVGMAPERRMKQEGQWGEWKEYGTCSRSCGGGVQKALRDCDSPRPSNGGKYCIGQRERYRSCNAQDCPWDTLGYREVQCAEYNNKDVRIHGIPNNSTWVPKYGVADNERCKLYCRVQGSPAFYMLKEKVVDGTPCDRNEDDICIDGSCRAAGCDHILDSLMKRDKCGVCGGDGTGCRVVKGTYNERGSFGYNEVMKIPAGSANIEITQHGFRDIKDDDNYLSLRTPNGDFLLNGGYQVSVFHQHIPIQDVILEYSGSDNVIERINGTGPIRSDIYLHVLSVGSLYPPDIRYEYMTAVSSNYRQPVSAYYYWRPADQWTPCSKECQGEQFEQYVCIDAINNRQSGERNCRLHRPEPTKKSRKCNLDCSTRWQIDSSICSVQCGHGEKRQTVSCVKVDANGRTNRAPDSECSSVPRPPERVACYVDCNGRSWTYSDWSQCTTTCGFSGVSRRNIYCLDGDSRQVDPRMCETQTREPLEKECNRVPCPKWTYTQWSECSKSCDGGVRMRHSMCVDSSDRELPHTRCNQREKHDRERCNEHICTYWDFGQWSLCNSQCGKGNMTRNAVCKSKNGIVDDSRCDIRERIVSKECHKPSCPQWKVGEWTQCLQTCGDHWSTRRVMCVDSEGRPMKDAECIKMAGRKPDTHKECNKGPCPFWRTGDWGPCSVPCGTGKKSRNVECVHNGQIVDNSYCGDQPPNTTEDCTLLACTRWQSTPWSPCSVSCGTGNQTRTVNCMRGNTKMLEVECDWKTKPRLMKMCERDVCNKADLSSNQIEPPTIWWTTGSWTECSEKCGKGTQRRLVKCRDKNRDLPEVYCGHLEKMDTEKECILRPCARWNVGQWKPCPASCGERVYQERIVTCTASEDGRKLSDSDCDVAQRPTRTRDCNLPSCPRSQPPLGKWLTHSWTKCSVTCGGGWRTRLVTCTTKVCDTREKPTDAEKCSEQICPPIQKIKYTWQIPPWTHCSVSCGGGVQRRQVWCEDDENRQRVEDSRCLDAKPMELKNCNEFACLKSSSSSTSSSIDNLTRWSAGPWSACSARCGKGVRKRVLSCLDVSKRIVASSRCDNATRPIEQHRCRFKHCPKWRGEPWGQCSATCGEGVRNRKVTCQRGRKLKVEERECGNSTKLSSITKCYNAACPVYRWSSSQWSKCVDPCSRSDQTRSVHCVNNLEVKAADRMCSNQTKPIDIRPCTTESCPYEWVPGPWNSCSRTCGNGTQLRTVECRLKETFVTTQVNMSAFQLFTKPKHFEPSVPKVKCQSLPSPPSVQECQINQCNAEFQWHAGPWGTCSQTCGQGIRRRKVRCYDRSGNRIPKEKCEETADKPKRTQMCFQRNCLPSTCQEIRAQHTTTHAVDGEYTVLLDGFAIRVYCHRMNETIPRAYVNVNKDTNYAEIYGKRLVYPHTCPHNGERNDSCQCTDDGDANAGSTYFSKVRVDLLNRKININDFTFTVTNHGMPVAYATAGDCYSMKDCPQGHFSMDLRGTGLRIVDDLQWEDRGHRTTSRIERTFNNAHITGRCGGYCGKCAPDKYKGLVFEIDQTQKSSIGTGR